MGLGGPGPGVGAPRPGLTRLPARPGQDGGMAAGTIPAYLRKPPGAIRTYWIDFGQFEEILAGDTLTGSPTVSASPPGELVLSNVAVATSVSKRGKAVAGQYVVVTIADGLTATGVYTLAVTVSTAAGAVLQVHCELRVEDI